MRLCRTEALTSGVCAWVHERGQTEVCDYKDSDDTLVDCDSDAVMHRQIRTSAKELKMQSNLIHITKSARLNMLKKLFISHIFMLIIKDQTRLPKFIEIVQEMSDLREL